MAQVQSQTVEWNDVQGLVLRGFGKHAFSAALLLRISDPVAARTWLAAACSRITTSDRAMDSSQECVFNIAFTASGLQGLEFQQEWLNSFPTAFLDGMSSESRSRILGDRGNSAPNHWSWGGADNGIDLIALLFAKDEETCDQEVASELARMLHAFLLVSTIKARLWDDEKEHFGFHDGISQPVIEGSPPSHHKNASAEVDGLYSPHNVIKAGEFLLGYRNEYGVLPDSLNLPPDADPTNLLPPVTMPDGSVAPDLGRNGSYLVVRQIDQHVAEFWTDIDQHALAGQNSVIAYSREKLAAKLIGRWISGAPMATSPVHDDPKRFEQNEFLYQGIDPDGFRCPFGAHVRRANPRDTLGDDPQEALKLAKRHRLIRRGRSYGPRIANNLDLSDKRQRGLLFIAVNANIERQFEFVQQTWINGTSFSGLYNESDPVFGIPDGKKDGTMTIPLQPVRRKLHDLGGYVTVRGGAYFFLPSIRALRYLAAMPQERPVATH